MSHGSRWFKRIGRKSGESCYTCFNRISIEDRKDDVLVKCCLDGIKREISFERKNCSYPYCAGYNRNESTKK